VRRLQRTLEDTRKALGFSRLSVAERIGVSHTMVGRYESGDSEPRVTVAARYAEALGITVAQFIELWYLGKWKGRAS